MGKQTLLINLIFWKVLRYEVCRWMKMYLVIYVGAGYIFIFFRIVVFVQTLLLLAL